MTQSFPDLLRQVKQRIREADPAEVFLAGVF